MKSDNIISEICRLTGMSEMTYNQILFDNGMQYLENECGESKWGVCLMSQQPLFWAWYRNLYYKFDIKLCQDMASLRENKSELRFLYTQAHEKFSFYIPEWIKNEYMHIASKVIDDDRG